MRISSEMNSLNKNFEAEIAALYKKSYFRNPSIFRKLRRIFIGPTDVTVIAKSPNAQRFIKNYSELGTQADLLGLTGLSLNADLETGPTGLFLRLNLKETFNGNSMFLNILMNQIPFLMPFSLTYFLNINWIEHQALLELHVADKTFFKKLSDNLLDIGYCQIRAINAYHEFCRTLLQLKTKDISKNNLDELRVYLACLNHAEICILLNKAILDKIITAYALIFGVSIEGKGKTDKKINKISSSVDNQFGKNHWSAFIQVLKSPHYETLNSYRTGLVHKISPRISAVHKRELGKMIRDLKPVEKIVSDSNVMTFFAFSTLMFLVNEKHIIAKTS